MTNATITARLLYLFARGYWLVTGLISAAAVFIYYSKGSGALSMLIYFKLITSAVLMVSNFRRKFPEDVFYLNFGVSLRLLVACAVAVDLMGWIITMIVIK